MRRLFADAELLDDVFVPFGVVFLEVIKQATPLADQHEKAAPGSVVLSVRFEVLRQLTNALAQQGNLDFGTAGVGAVRLILVNYGGFLLSS
jgi:hypothetical protein